MTTSPNLPDLQARIAWSRMAEPGDAVAGRLIDAIGAPEALHVVTHDDAAPNAAALIGLPEHQVKQALSRWLPRHDRDQAQRDLDLAGELGAEPLLPGDQHWPAGFGESPPTMLWVRGNIGLLGTTTLGIVGARACSGYGAHVTTEVAAHAAENDVTIVSGAAYGVDAAAHRAALAAGGPTIAVLAGGVDRPYPRAHSSLLDRIAEAGCVVSEMPLGSAPTRWRFLARHRIITALSAALLVTEAGARSGAVAQAQSAHEACTPVGAVPGPVTSATSGGCHRLIRERTAQLVTTPEEALALIPGHDSEGAQQ